MRSTNYLVKAKEDSQRIDIFISNKERSLSRSRIKSLILKEKIKLNNKIIKALQKKLI